MKHYSSWTSPTTSPSPPAPQTTPKSPAPPERAGKLSHLTPSSLSYHAYTIYLFSCNNVREIIGLGFLFGAAHASVAARLAGMGPSRSAREILGAAPAMLLWSWANLLVFNLHNQRHPAAVAEDAINKPWRPLPAGRLTPAQATRLLHCAYPAVLLLLPVALCGGMLPCAVEALLCLWYNEWGGAAHPLLKNALNGLGFACFFAGPLEVATGRGVAGSAPAAAWLLVLAAAVATTAHAQDFRDCEGDRAAGRRTVPIVLGDAGARVLLAGGVAVWTVVACWFWDVGIADWEDYGVACLAGLLMTGSFFVDRTPAGDAFSWKLYPLWMLGLFLLPLRMSKVASVQLFL